MSKPAPPDKDKDKKGADSPDSATVLSGTTLRVYRLLYREGRPLNIHDVQRGLGLSSASVAQYHLRKLLQAGLIKEQNEGYIVDRVVFENMIRIRRTVIPFQIAFAIFFGTLLFVLLIFVTSTVSMTSPIFLFALTVNVSALVLFSYEALRSIKHQSI